MKTPFEIGRTYYLPLTHPEQIQVTCPVCYGKKKVVIILGNDERVEVECDGCGLGYEGPRGFVHDYSYEARVTPFTIDSVVSMHGDSWYVRSTTGEQANWGQLCETDEQAMECSRQQMQSFVDENMRRSATSKKQKLREKTWSVRYHEDCIREVEKKIAWHRQKVSERKQVSP